MPIFSSAGKAKIVTGRGAFHPGVVGVDAPTSSPQGSLGTITLGGNSINTTTITQNTVSGDRDVVDPFFSGPFVFSIASGSLPPGFALNSATGVVSGTHPVSSWNPDATYSFTVRATDATGLHVTDRAYSIALSVPFEFKQILSKGYVVGGYISLIPFRNVHRMTYSTDTTANLNDLIGTATQYCAGASSRTRAYSFGTADTAATGSNKTEVFAMNTETAIAHSAPRNHTTSKDDLATGWVTDIRSYLFGGGNATVDKYTFATESSVALGAPSNNVAGEPATGTGTGSAQGDDTTVLAWGETAAKFNLSTEAPSAVPTFPVVSGQQKGMPTKLGKGYMGNEGSYNGGINFRVWIFATDSYAIVGKPGIGQGGILPYGEENMVMGQVWGYIMGHYDGAQKSDCIKLLFPTNSGYYMGFGATAATPAGFNVPSPSNPLAPSGGIGGRSSGTTHWAE
jgi:hypothetical protein